MKHHTQSEKIAQVDEQTLVVGIDIGSAKHYARCFNNRGMELSRKAFSFENNEEGFEHFRDWAVKNMTTHGKQKVMVGLEPTGHYWFPLGWYLEEQGIRFGLVAPQHVKHSKELDDNLPRKDDNKDPMVIAKLVIDGRYALPYMPEGNYAELRVAFTRRCELVAEMTRVKNRIQRWFNIYFPEYQGVYSKVDAASGLKVLRKAPLPQDIVALGAEGINQIWRDAKCRAVGMKRAKTLVEAAAHSVGGKQAGQAARMNLWQLLDQHELLTKQLDEMNEQILSILAEIPEAEKLLKIPGIGMVVAAGFLAEVGDVRRFTDPKQIQKLAGLAVTENSSGKHKGQSGISRRGRKRLRWIMYQAAMCAVKSNAEMKELHHYYTERRKNPLKPMQSLMVVAGKLIRVFFGVIKHDSDYDPIKLRQDIRRIEAKAA